MEYITNSTNETFALAKRLSKKLAGGSVLALRGGLGVGKTTFVSGLLKAFGYNGYVSSPTFNIVNIYNAKYNVYHFDMYRISSIDDLLSTGYFDYLDDKNGIIIIEWSENLETLPENSVILTIKRLGDEKRSFSLEGPICEF